MTKTGGSKHQKRISSPRNWVIPRKKHKFVYKADPGPHGALDSMPLGILLRDVLKEVETSRELRYILNRKLVSVDGRVVKNLKFPVGLMDVISISEINKSFRILPHELHVMMPYEIKKASSDVKACQIKNKTTIKGGIVQLNLHDGRNILLPKEEGIEQKYRTRDTVIIKLPSQEIVEHYPFEEGKYAIITQGRNVGKHGTIKNFQWRFGPRASTVTITTDKGEEVQTTPEYIFVIGDKGPFWGADGVDKS
ncbi:MAG: 30S ribosomal protein S4e [Asgard group archaeon]|nr:30S ribosomal protein S4e [Asgard group archaeon]